MKTAPIFWLLKFYSLGCGAALLFIGCIHLYSLCFEPHFRHAEAQNILLTTLICGFPFGVSIWAWIAYQK